MTTSKMMMQITKHTRIFMSFHHICLRTRLAPRRKPCADTARLSVLSCRESRRSPRSETPIMFERIARIVSSISYRKRIIPLVSSFKRRQANQRNIAFYLFLSFFLFFFFFPWEDSETHPGDLLRLRVTTLGGRSLGPSGSIRARGDVRVVRLFGHGRKTSKRTRFSCKGCSNNQESAAWFFFLPAADCSFGGQGTRRQGDGKEKNPYQALCVNSKCEHTALRETARRKKRTVIE